jgi:hypothetical protein
MPFGLSVLRGKRGKQPQSGVNPPGQMISVSQKHDSVWCAGLYHATRHFFLKVISISRVIATE